MLNILQKVDVYRMKESHVISLAQSNAVQDSNYANYIKDIKKA